MIDKEQLHGKDREYLSSEISQAEKQQTVEYTKDGSLDLFGNPAIRSKTGGLRTLPFVLGVQFLSCISYYGIGTNLVLYLTEKLHEDVPSASANVANWNGSVLLFSVIGALLADSYLGRFWTSVGFLGIYFLGLVATTLTTILPSLKPLPCSSVSTTTCQAASGQRRSIFYLALYIQALGFGGFQPCNISFGADQYDEQHETERPKKSLFFNLVYVGSSCGGLIGNTVLIYLEQNVGYQWGFGVSTLFLAISVFIYLAGILIFRHQRPKGNPLTRVAQVLIATVRKWRLKTPSDGSELYELPQTKGNRQMLHSDKARFLDKAAVRIEGDINEAATRNPWRLCTVTQVEEVKFIIRVLPIWASNVCYSTFYVQVLTLFVEQASTMDLRLGNRFNIPPASIGVFETLSVCFWAFAYEKWVVPVTRRFTGHPRGLTLLQRIGTGLVIVTCAMVTAAVLEINRLRLIKSYGLSDKPGAVVPMTVFWLIPQYFLVGASEAFTFVGQYEFFYDQAPDEIRGLSSALQLTTIALGNFVSSLLVTIVTHITKRGSNPGWIADNLNAGHIDYFYWLLVVLGIINFIAYVICASGYEYTRATYTESTDE